MNKKIMATFAILMVALSIAGFVYATWYDEIYINGTVEMGELIFGFTETISCDDGKMLYFTNVDEYDYVTPEPKPVGEITCVLTDPETSHKLDPPKTVYKTLTITIENAYPEYFAWCYYTLDNGGTIPLDVTNYCVLINSGDGLTYGWEDTNGDGKLDCIVAYYDINGNGVRDPEEPPVINIWFEPLFLGQIDPCNSVYQFICIHIKEPALECHTYQFYITIHAEQWN